MNQQHELILNTLKEAFQLQRDDDSQWLAAVSLKDGIAADHRYHLRILVLTNSSPYLDGTDAVVSLGEDGALIDPDVFQETPELQGSPMIDALNWLMSYGPLIHWQAKSPF